jgi:hypothetical protein|tara:strand:+ start:238 stop:435 length:198 start_codon:yes stop_codon:yes gene_type:complete
MNNEERAESARKVLSYFCEIVENDDEIEILATDLICNIKHLLVREGIDQERVFELAEDFYEAEAE